MILEDATHEAFGYYARDLKPHSDKLIISACELCGAFRIIKKHNYHTFCGSCIQKGRLLTEEHKAKIGAASKGNISALGCKHTEEAKAKTGAASKGNKYALGCKRSEEAKAKMSAAKKGNKYALGCKRSEEAKAKLRGEKNHTWRGGKKRAWARSRAKRKQLGYTLLMPLAEGEVGHHVTDEHVIGVPAEVHTSIGGRRKKHRTRVLQWLKANDKKKYLKVLCTLAEQ